MWKKKWPSHCVDSAQQQLTYQGVINPAFLTDPKQCNMGWQKRVNSIPARHSAAQNTVQMAWEVTTAHAASGARLCVCCASTMHPQPWSQTYPLPIARKDFSAVVSPVRLDDEDGLTVAELPDLERCLSPSLCSSRRSCWAWACIRDGLQLVQGT